MHDGILKTDQLRFKMVDCKPWILVVKMDLAKYRLIRAKKDLETAADNLGNGKYRASVNYTDRHPNGHITMDCVSP